MVPTLVAVVTGISTPRSEEAREESSFWTLKKKATCKRLPGQELRLRDLANPRQFHREGTR